ncbi:MAG: hypothetical protein IPK12_11010 [Gemmatimonadetes bacterium]|nr:hypothetical protein [Gemmatimonadota bacterium]
MRTILRLLALLLVVPAVLPAQDFDFYDRGPYRAAVPRPESILGYRVGSQHTMYHQQQGVLDRLIAANPERVRTEVIGKTWEGKVMRLLIISSPENIARLDEIRANLAKLADPRATSAAEAQALAVRTPVTVLLTHSVHGNEPAGFEAAMQTAYQLLASDEPATLEILKNVVVLINPSQNPDGHERFAAWSNSIAVGSEDPIAIEQTEPWAIWGRYNHYRFDMNRDILAQSQAESRAIGSVYVRWRPQVVADLHSTTSQYFFPPVSEAHNQNLPAATYQGFEQFGRANAAAFDRYSWQYYVRNVFDFFYPGYIDMWPSMRGGLGMTFETDGGPELKKKKDDGSYVTFEMAIAHHYVASLATLGQAAAVRAQRLQDFYDFHATGMAEVEKRPFRRVFFTATNPTRLQWIVRRLLGEEIEVQRLTQPFTTGRAVAYVGTTPAAAAPARGRTGAATLPGAERRTFPAGTYVVDLRQPEARLATSILEPTPAFDSAFVRRQFAMFARNQRRGPDESHEGYEFYDVTAWSLPLTLGLDAWWSDDLAPLTAERVTAAPVESAAAPARAQSAYLFSNEGDAGALLAVKLTREGFRVGMSTQPLMADGKGYPRSTFVVRVQRNPATVHERIQALAVETGVTVVPVRSAFADTGQVGVGSEAIVPVHAPKILLAGGDGVDQTAFGAVWYFLEREFGVPVTPVNVATLRYASYDDYNVLIIPNASAGRLWRELGEDGAQRLKRWVESGGAVIAMGDAVDLLARKEVELTTVKPLEADSTAAKDTTVATDGVAGPPLVSPNAGGNREPEYVYGAIFRATLDPTHWLTGGYQGDVLPVFLESSRMLKPSERGANPVAFTGDRLTLAGFTWPNNTERFLRNSVWAAVESAGSGNVILFAENPVYRGFWRGPAKLLTNALLFGTGR